MKNKTYLGIELGSTRIKASLVGADFAPVASGSFEWENKLENGYWTYDLSEIHAGIKGCFSSLADNMNGKCEEWTNDIEAMGISGMMHGYLAFDKDDNLLVPFRTWRNNTTGEAAESLSKLFNYNIPQRWSIAHLYQAILNGEDHVKNISYITTLAGYIHYLLTGRHEVGICEASGMFPVCGNDYDEEMLDKFEKLVADKGFKWNIRDILPKVRLAGEKGAYLTEAGAKFLDESGALKAGIPVCPPEGDAGTGMVATNSVMCKTGNVSAGTSVFSMLVLDKPLKNMYREIDIVATPDGLPVAMAHCNNCSCELDAWVKIFGEFATLMGYPANKSALYEALYKNAMKADADCGGVVVYNYLAGEQITEVENGRPMYYRMPDGNMNLSGFMRAQLYSAIATLKIGMDILYDNEGMSGERFLAHGGLFKVEGVAQQVLADAIDAPVSVMETAGEGGAWGMALLAAFMIDGEDKNLGKWLENNVFADMNIKTVTPDEEGRCGFLKYMKLYKEGLKAQRIF